jgi:hypothetical protein
MWDRDSVPPLFPETFVSFLDVDLVLSTEHSKCVDGHVSVSHHFPPVTTTCCRTEGYVRHSTYRWHSFFASGPPREHTKSRASLLHSPASGRHNRPKRTLNVLPKGSAVLIWQLWRSFASSEQASGWTDSCTDNYHQGWTTENSSFASYTHTAPSRPQVNAGSNPTLSPGTACRILVPGPDGRTLTTTLHG